MEIVGNEYNIDLVGLNLIDVTHVEKLFGMFITPDDFYGICFKDNFDDDDYLSIISDTDLDMIFLVSDTNNSVEIFNKVKNEIKNNMLNDGIDYDSGSHVALYKLNDDKSIVVQIDGGYGELSEYDNSEEISHFNELDEIKNSSIKNEIKKIIKL